MYTLKLTQIGNSVGENGIVLIPLNSGLVFTQRAATEARLAPKVLIPLNSGLVFTLTLWAYDLLHASLNPFEFRAGIYSDMKTNDITKRAS